MDETAYQSFIQSVKESERGYVEAIHQQLLESCTCEIKSSKSGYTLSYLLSASNVTLANMVTRKTGIKLRLYPQYLQNYECFLDTLPKKMKKDIKKASVCKRLINPDDCNPKCKQGYTFHLDDEVYQKCRFMAFMPTIQEENFPFIQAFIKNELHFHS